MPNGGSSELEEAIRTMGQIHLQTDFIQLAYKPHFTLRYID